MKTIVLISCCKLKLNHKAPAEKLYQSTGFKKQLAYAKSLSPDSIFIISAKYHLVPLSMELEPYDVCLNNQSIDEKKKWAKKVLEQLSKDYNLSKDKFIILAGKDYYSELIKEMNLYDLPLKGSPMGERLQWLDEHTFKSKDNSLCMEIHKWTNSLPRFSWPFEVCNIPENGVYIFFEEGEKYFEYDRIVRVGTHTGDNNLVKRIEEHLVRENKDRSIFRKNIGRALLNKIDDSFLEKWNCDRTTPENRSKVNWTYADELKLREVELEVSNYMRNHFSFTCIPINSKEERLAYEAYLIKTISADPLFKPSENWLGKASPVKKIADSGLWLVNELSKKTIACSPKYKPLYDYLCKEKSYSIKLTFDEINRLLSPASLPSSAYTIRQWWANSDSHSQASSWMAAGYKTTQFTRTSITFTK